MYLPEELYRYIYTFLNPISKPFDITINNLFFCERCGENLKNNGNWYLLLDNDIECLSYTCLICLNLYIYYNE